MNSCAIYRIVETIRIMVFVVLAMIVFDFYPGLLHRLIGDRATLAIYSHLQAADAWHRHFLGLTGRRLHPHAR